MLRTPYRLAPAAALLPLLLLAGCGADEKATPEVAEPKPVGGTITVGDGAASFTMPEEGWVEAWTPDGPIVFGAQLATDETQQVFVGITDSREEAEAFAIATATKLGENEATCRRDLKDTTFGASYRVVDCLWSEPEPYHKLMVVLGDEDGGAMVLVGGAGEKRSALAPVLTPLLESWTWH